MLDELLARLQDGGTRRVVDLARELETTPELVELMLEDLVRMGYLKPMEHACGAACAGCGMSGLCAAAAGDRTWILATEKTGDPLPRRKGREGTQDR